MIQCLITVRHTCLYMYHIAEDIIRFDGIIMGEQKKPGQCTGCVLSVVTPGRTKGTFLCANLYHDNQRASILSIYYYIVLVVNLPPAHHLFLMYNICLCLKRVCDDLEIITNQQRLLLRYSVRYYNGLLSPLNST